MFRYKRSINLSYERQGYIYFASLLYYELPAPARKKILDLCTAIGGREYSKPLLEFVTTNASATRICLKHHLSEASLYRYVKRYYESFPKTL